ncbi:MAG: hypothetical protein WBD24_06950 [Candidatus Omnitrophota bacterium]
MKRAVIFNYNSKFAKDIEKTLLGYNLLHPADPFEIDIYPYKEFERESDIGHADVIIHSGGKGRPVKDDIAGVPRIYICHSHEWKAVYSGGKIVQLSGCMKGVQEIDVLEEDEVLGKKGKLPIMKYHELAIKEPPKNTKVLAVSRAIDSKGKEIEIIEALRYPDGSTSVQGHPEEGTAAHIFYNHLNKVASSSLLQPV